MDKEGDRDGAGEMGVEMSLLEEENATLRRRLGIPSGPPKSTLASLEGENATLLQCKHIRQLSFLTDISRL